MPSFPHKVQNQMEAFVHSVQRLDIEMIDLILEEKRTYQNFPKHMFIDMLGRAFKVFKDHGDTFLDCHQGYCNTETCNFRSPGYCFIGNHSKKYLNLVIENAQGVVIDIYECAYFMILGNGFIDGERVHIRDYSLE